MIALILAATVSVAHAKPPPEYQQLYDELFSMPPEQHDIPAALQIDAMPWAVGQWTVYRKTDKKGNVSMERMAVVHQDDCGLWVETVTQDPKHRTVSKVCYTSMPKVYATLEETAGKAFDLVQVMITQTDGKKPSGFDFRTPEGQMMRQMAGPMLGSVIKDWKLDAAATEDVTVAGGTFRGAIKTEFQAKIAFIKVSGTGFVHPSVPLNGTVKMQTNDGSTTELVDFGTTGGPSSEIPDVWSL